MSTLKSLRQALAEAVKEGETLQAKAAPLKEIKAAEAEIAELEERIALAVKAQERQARLARPAAGQANAGDDTSSDVNPMERTLSQVRAMGPQGKLKKFDAALELARKGFGFTPSREAHFRSLGEQLQAIAGYYSSKGTNEDRRLVRAPTGAGEVDPTAGGFLVQVDFASAIFMLAHDMGEIIDRVNKLPVSANANGIKIPGIDETSRATGSRWGGVQSYWVGDGTSVTATKPKFRVIEFDLKKMMSVMYTTSELLQDAAALGAIAAQAFAEEVMFMTEDAIWEGDGSNKPLGILNSAAKIAVAKETGQAAGTVLKENIDKMWARLWSRSVSNSAWFINQDVIPQLQALNQPVGTGGLPVFIPAGGLSAAPYETLYGRPIIRTEYCSTVGTEGDIGLCDLSQYMLVDKSGIDAATSMHAAFLTDEMVFRITYRVDGKPLWHSPLTPFKGSNTRSPFITLANR